MAMGVLGGCLLGRVHSPRSRCAEHQAGGLSLACKAACASRS